MATAVVGEKLGRRKSVGIGAIISMVGAILQATSFGRAQLIVGRVVSGIGLGIINSTVPVMQAEFSPKASRGIYVCAQLSTLNFGIFLVYWIDYAFVTHNSSYAWRIPTILQCIILLAILGLLTLIPETPRWLASHDCPDECLQVLARIRDVPENDSEVQRLHTIITETVAFEASRQAGWKEIVRSDPIKSRRRFLIACGIQMFQQLGGINAIICKIANFNVDNTLLIQHRLFRHIVREKHRV
jgi:MFS family permease